MKLLGVCLILCAGTALGVSGAYRMRLRPRQIRALILCLSSLEAQIVYAQTRMDEALARASSSANERAVCGLFRQVADTLSADRKCDVREAFRHVYEKMLTQLELGSAEWNILLFLGENLGQCDTEKMAKQIELAIDHLTVREQVARERVGQKEKLVLYLGIGSALMVILVCL